MVRRSGFSYAATVHFGPCATGRHYSIYWSGGKQLDGQVSAITPPREIEHDYRQSS